MGSEMCIRDRGYTGRFAEGRAWLARALALPRDDTPGGRAAVARAVQAAGGLAYNQGDYAAAGPLLEEGLARATAARPPGVSSLGRARARASQARPSA